MIFQILVGTYGSAYPPASSGELYFTVYIAL